MCSALGQFADFVGNDGKAAALFTGTCRFDGGIEGEQIGLTGDVRDDAQDGVDLRL